MESLAGAVSNAAAIRTRAVKMEGGWRLNGAKQFLTSDKIGGLGHAPAPSLRSCDEGSRTARLDPGLHGLLPLGSEIGLSTGAEGGHADLEIGSIECVIEQAIGHGIVSKDAFEASDASP